MAPWATRDGTHSLEAQGKVSFSLLSRKGISWTADKKSLQKSKDMKSYQPGRPLIPLFAGERGAGGERSAAQQLQRRQWRVH